MDVVVSVRELCVAHVCTQIGQHGVQVFALTHPAIQPVGSESMTKIIKTRGTAASSCNGGFLQNLAERLLQPPLSVKAALRVGEERLTFWHNGGYDGAAI